MNRHRSTTDPRYSRIPNGDILLPIAEDIFRQRIKPGEVFINDRPISEPGKKALGSELAAATPAFCCNTDAAINSLHTQNNCHDTVTHDVKHVASLTSDYL